MQQMEKQWLCAPLNFHVGFAISSWFAGVLFWFGGFVFCFCFVLICLDGRKTGRL